MQDEIDQDIQNAILVETCDRHPAVTISASAIEFSTGRFFLAVPAPADLLIVDEDLGFTLGIAPSLPDKDGHYHWGRTNPSAGGIGAGRPTTDSSRISPVRRKPVPLGGYLSSGSGFVRSRCFLFDFGDGVETAVGGGGGWTETVQLGDGAGSIGEREADWTLQLDSGWIEAEEDGSLDLSDDASGTVILGDGSQLHFHEVGRIVF